MTEEQTTITNDESYQNISVNECILEAFYMFKKYWLIILIVELFFLFFNISDKIPYIGDYIQIILYPPLLAGYFLFYLNVGNNTNPSYKNILNGFSFFLLSTRFFWFFILVIIICFIPTYFFIDIETFQYLQLSKFFEFEYLIFYTNMILILFLLIRYSFIFYILVDEPKRKVIEICIESSRMLQGHVFQFAKLMALCIIIPTLIYYALSNSTSVIIITDIGTVSQFNLSSKTLVLSIIYYLGINYFIFSIIYISIVRFYLKLKVIKQKPPFTVTPEPL